MDNLRLITERFFRTPSLETKILSAFFSRMKNMAQSNVAKQIYKKTLTD